MEKGLTGPLKQSGRYINWSSADLDRCEHGRHSIDHCLDCEPSALAHGNRFLIDGVTETFAENGYLYVRIGTTHGGDPIFVPAISPPREVQ